MNPTRRASLRTAYATLIALALPPACVPADPEAPPRPPARASADTASWDLADYVLPSCDHASATYQTSDDQRRRVVPLGVDGPDGHFVVVKSADGRGFEEWSVDADWFRVRRDTTWAYESDGRWCDVQCGTNDGSTCAARWRGDAGDFVYTLYRDEDEPDRGAPWYPRHVSDGQTFTTRFRVDALRYASCGPCDTNFDGETSHTVRVAKLLDWQGFDDVIAMHVVDGAGAGEVYYYARGQGWVGFEREDGSQHEQVVGPAPDAWPQDACDGGRREASICAALGGGDDGAATGEADPPGCPCRGDVDNYCGYAPGTPGCAMTAPGGYCDPDGDGSYADADWARGWSEFHAACP